MISTVTRFGRIFMWLLVSLLIVLALAVTALRICLPQMNRFQAEIQDWLNQNSSVQLAIADVQGYWRNTHPSLSLQTLQVHWPDSNDIQLNASSIELEFDLWQSLWQRQPVIAELTINGMVLDLRAIDWLALQQNANPEQSAQGRGIQQLDDLLLRQLDDFTLKNSAILYRTFAGDLRQLDIEKLRWQNSGQRHFAEGEVSIAGTNINSLLVSANFIDHGSLRDISGDFYASADKVRVLPWLTRYLKDQTGIQKGQLSFHAWASLERSRPVDGYLELKPSQLLWHNGEQQHELLLESGIVQLTPSESGWQVNAHSLRLRSDDQPWPVMDMALDWQPQQWRLNLSQLNIESLLPLAKLIPESTTLNHWLATLQPKGVLEDVRIAKRQTLESLRYSATLSDGGMAQWDLLPQVNFLQAQIQGSLSEARVQATLVDDVLEYGEVFQAPLNIRQGEVDIVWQQGQHGWSLWADKVTVATPDLQAIGEFRLDFPNQASPFLSFYLEADLFNAGETWRYLPTLALGQSLTDYLSSAIQAGRVNTAKLVWYGALDQFPYQKNNGIFQAWVGLKQAKFAFDTAWPAITDLQLDLLFENAAMHLDSRAATLMEVSAERVTGRIPELAEFGHIEIEAIASAKQGNAIRDYMMATPLVDSVGAALTTIQVKGPVRSQFQLNIPFHSGAEPRAWGFAELADNAVDIETPPMSLEAVSGKIEFDNDRVSAAGLQARLLNQPVSIDFKGEEAKRGYAVNIDLLGDWEVKPLRPLVGEQWLSRIKGHAPWQASVDIQLNDVGFTYQLDGKADLRRLESRYPFPLNKALKAKGQALLQASGNQEMVSARLQLPQAKYQAEIDLTPAVPELKATNLVLGQGSFKISPVVGHHVQLRSQSFNLDKWLAILSEQSAVKTAPSKLASLNTPTIPMPERIEASVSDLTLAGLEWHDVDFNARRKDLGWLLVLDSQEIKGQANYLEPYDLTVALERLHLFLPQLEFDKERLLVDVERQKLPLISDFDRQFHQLMPNLTLTIKDFWLQGYKIGQASVDFQRQGDTLLWKSIDFTSGANQLHVNGTWTLTEKTSHTQMNLDMQGDNNSDLMARFGINSGIQRAPFEIKANTQWDGAPWSMQIHTLQGKVETKLGKGVISDVGGAARLLGLFSLDSILRKMQLDFSDVFDKGMAFNSITGSGDIAQGVFVTNNIKMDATAGEMKIKGLADLNSRTVDAEVNFVPDITSGIPVLTAFAVTPQTALYVLAITTVISPVVEVFTQVNYQVQGPLDSPTVKELSRSKGEFKLPETLRNLAK
ncbi:YhdP family protein [Vibrio sp. dsl-7]|uniref:YhdP family protein n=1 Tax=Vibrio chanodichtyis TaxID=3027932 RepID=A0ABT5V2I0_9VIBR|nr:YhdP family protein [Vibrio chanodichtyis]MDE1515794.1 YhdP family protein [Vibrio chanodichtyis]